MHVKGRYTDCKKVGINRYQWVIESTQLLWQIEQCRVPSQNCEHQVTLGTGLNRTPSSWNSWPQQESCHLPPLKYGSDLPGNTTGLCLCEIHWMPYCGQEDHGGPAVLASALLRPGQDLRFPCAAKVSRSWLKWLKWFRFHLQTCGSWLVAPRNAGVANDFKKNWSPGQTAAIRQSSLSIQKKWTCTSSIKYLTWTLVLKKNWYRF